MLATLDRTGPRMLHPFHAVLLAATIPPFLGALLSDIAYAQTYQVQWTNFASWLVVFGLVFTGVVLLLAVIDLFHAYRRTTWSIAYAALVLVMFVLGFINSLVHAKDAWAAMPGGLVLSAIVTLLAILATWLGFAGYRAGVRP